MANKFKRIVSAFLTVVMCMSLFTVPAFAKTVFDNGNIWYGDEITREIKAGTDGYTFMTLYKGPYANYETSNHVLMGAGAVSL